MSGDCRRLVARCGLFKSPEGIWLAFVVLAGGGALPVRRRPAHTMLDGGCLYVDFRYHGALSLGR